MLEKAICSTSSCHDLRPIVSALRKATRKLQSLQAFLVILSSQHICSAPRKADKYFEFNCTAEIQDRPVLASGIFIIIFFLTRHMVLLGLRESQKYQTVTEMCESYPFWTTQPSLGSIPRRCTITFSKYLISIYFLNVIAK